MLESLTTRAARPTAIRWRILLILALASFISYVLRTNLSFAAPAMMDFAVRLLFPSRDGNSPRRITARWTLTPPRGGMSLRWSL